MATATRVKVWDFTDDSIYTVAGDAAIASNALSMTDPALALPFDDGGWDSEPEYDENGDALPVHETYYTAQAGGEDLSVADGMLVVQAKRTAETGPYLYLFSRFGVDLDDSVYCRVYYDGCAIHILGKTQALEGCPGFPVDEWAEMQWRFTGTVLSGRTGDTRTLTYDGADKTDAGTIQLHCLGTDNYFTIGNGGAAAAPVFYYRRYGTCELKAANAWTVPLKTTALGKLSVTYETEWKGSGTDPADVTSCDINLQYKLTGGDWTDVPADGDMSDVTFTPGTTTLLVRVNDGSGYGMDNGDDPRYVPKVHAIVLTYTVAAPDYATEDEIRDVLVSLKAALDADETLAAYSGWGGSEVLWPEYGTATVFRNCGVIIVPDMSPETRDSSCGGVYMKHYVHSMKLYPWMRLDCDIEDNILSATGLLAFAADVKNALATDTLGDSITNIEIANTASATVRTGLDEDDVLPAVEIELNITSKPFQGS